MALCNLRYNAGLFYASPTAMTQIDPFHPLLPATEQQRVSWSGLHGAATALALVEAARQNPGPVLVVTRDSESAERLRQELLFFRGDE